MPASRLCILVKSKPSNVFGSLDGSLLRRSSVSTVFCLFRSARYVKTVLTAAISLSPDLSLPILRAMQPMDFPCATQLGYAVPLLWAKMCVVAHSFQLSTLIETTNIVAFWSVPRLHSAGHPVALRMLIRRPKY